MSILQLHSLATTIAEHVNDFTPPLITTALDMFDLVDSHWGSLPLHIAGLVTMLLELCESSLYKMSRAEEIATLIAKAYWYSDPTTNIYDDTTVVKETMRKVKTASSSLANGPTTLYTCG